MRRRSSGGGRNARPPGCILGVKFLFQRRGEIVRRMLL